MTRALFGLLIVVSVSGSTVWSENSGLPDGVQNDQNPLDKTISPTESLQRLSVPDGFHITLFAAEPNVAQPIAADFDDRGRLWVAECYSHPVWKPTGNDRILIFEDSDGDGQFDERKVFWNEGNYLTGLLYGHGGVWICNTPNLMFLPDRDGDDVPDGPPEIHLDGWARSSPHNVFNNLTWGPDGWMYGSIGLSSPSRVGKPGTASSERIEMNQGIWRYHPVNRKFEVVAHGTVNPWGLDFNDWGEGFFTNCVQAHLWHLVPGAHYLHSNLSSRDPIAFTRIESITDHLHWGGGTWRSSRGGTGKHSVAGGGHAHTGAMIYLGSNWPERYRNTFFTGNIHGNRINNDTLERHRSSYIGRHGADFLFGNHKWFRCLWQIYGPDGGVLIGDWHDYGECHDNDGTHRTSGRIYKVLYGKVKQGEVKKAAPPLLGQLSDEQLVELQLHPNDWFVRHARRLLHERAVAGHDLSVARIQLLQIFSSHPDITRQLRAMWTLYVIDAADTTFLLKQLAHANEHVRAWAVRLLCDGSPPEATIVKQLAELGVDEPSALVRLYLAAALQRIPIQQRWDLATALVAHQRDAGDHNIPHMIWYGIAPLVKSDPTRAMQLLATSQLPLVRQHIARIAAVEGHFGDIEGASIELDILRGMRLGLRGVKNPPRPRGWSEFYDRLSTSDNPELRRESRFVALLLGVRKAEVQLRSIVMTPSAPLEERAEALQALAESRVDGLSASLLELLDDTDLRRPALRALAAYHDPRIPQKILGLYPTLEQQEKQDAINLLASRRPFAAELLDAVQAQVIDRNDISAYTARQIAGLGDKDIEKRLRAVWGDIRQTPEAGRKKIADYKARLTPAVLAHANVQNGRRIYEKTCSQCHRLHGKGGTIGPDLTGSNRNNIDYVLGNVFAPSAAVGRDYQLWTVSTVDGRVVSGIIAQRDDKRVILQTIDQQVVLSVDDIDEMLRSSLSIMPEGQLDGLPIESVRDLIAYLAK